MMSNLIPEAAKQFVEFSSSHFLFKKKSLYLYQTQLYLIYDINDFNILLKLTIQNHNKFRQIAHFSFGRNI